MATLISWSELHGKTYEATPFLLENYICQAGITFLFGASSIGKSPLTWSMARALALGESWFGLATRQSRVLYIDNDSPEAVAAHRLQKLPPVPGVWFLFTPPLGIPQCSEDIIRTIQEAKDVVNPDVVFVNTLRKASVLDDKDSRTASIIYGSFQAWFPGSALVFVHHPRKALTVKGVSEDPRETASGSLAFINDAQIGVMLQRYKGKLRLLHQKSQVGPKVAPLPLKLESDGVTLTCPEWQELAGVYQLVNDMTVQGSKDADIDRALMSAYGISISTARRRRYAVEKYGLTPPWAMAEELTETEG